MRDARRLSPTEEEELQSQIEERCLQEEMLWKQKSRISWLKEGECNTSFFHHSTIQHRMHNIISCLKKQDGSRLETHKDIEKELVSYYEDLLSEENQIQGRSHPTSSQPHPPWSQINTMPP
jgi:hypothetical protein